MNLNFSKLEAADIQAVVGNLWERGQKEAALNGYSSRDDVMAHLLSKSSDHGYVMKVADEAVAVFGASNHGHCYYTWFVATERFSEVGKTATLLLKGFLREKVSYHPGAKLEMLSAVDHPDAERWFKVLGFKLKKREGLFSQYEYQRKSG